MRNIRLLHALAALRGLRFGLAVYVLYSLRLTDYTGIGVVETVAIATAFAMEVPTGMAADRWGRRPALIGSFAIEVVGYLVLAAAGGLGGLIAALFVLQTGRALHSGTFEAMLWESLAEEERGRTYVTVLGRTQALGLAAFALSCVAGGFLYGVDPRLPYLVAAAGFALAALLGLALEEPARSTAAILPGSSREAVALLVREWSLVGPLLVVGAFLAVNEELLDEVLAVEFGFPAEGLGALFAAAYLLAAAAAHASGALERRWSARRLVFGMALVAAATLIAAPALGLLAGGLTFLLRHAMRAVHDTVVAGQLVAAAGPSNRATVLSVFNAARSLPYLLSAWAIGAAMDAISARGFALWFGLAMAAAGAAAWRVARWSAAGRLPEERPAS